MQIKINEGQKSNEAHKKYRKYQIVIEQCIQIYKNC